MEAHALSNSEHKPGAAGAGAGRDLLATPSRGSGSVRLGLAGSLTAPPGQQTKLVLESFGESQMLVVGLLTEWFVGHHCDQLSVCLF